MLHTSTTSECAAQFHSLLVTCKLNGIEPNAYFRDILSRIADHTINSMDELVP